MKLEREWVEELIFGGDQSRRFTQDSPVLPDVWIRYTDDPARRIDLLLTPYRDVSTGRLSMVLDRRLKEERTTDGWQERHANEARISPDIAYNRATVAACLGFDELVRVVLPLSDWWKKTIVRNYGDDPIPALKALRDREDLTTLFPPISLLRGAGERPESHPLTARHLKGEAVPPEVLWMIRIIGSLKIAATTTVENPYERLEKLPEEMQSLLDIMFAGMRSRSDLADGIDLDLRAREWERIQSDPETIVQAVIDLLNGVVPAEEETPLVWSISRNRPAHAAISRSVPAIKGDAACNLFNIKCRDLTWAVIDSGIDARHPAFRRMTDENIPEELLPEEEWSGKTRVVATYDFTLIRKLLSTDPADHKALPAALKQRKKGSSNDLKDLADDLQKGKQIDWNVLQKFLRIPHDKNYRPPIHEHGTHVAGILAADWRNRDAPANEAMATRGVCHDIKLYDLRVLDDNGAGDEFAIMAALQFIRHLNAHQDYVVVHGANMSLSIRHDVANYACGRTPVCEECERVVGAGVVVVAAAGNQGYLQYMTSKGVEEGYRSISITDPGNSEDVITVGATHRYMPHTYGVSYFSSRGPTGDGRLKPDLVAPGEKILAPVPGEESRTMDGTSMAAPHVSGAAALLLARHRELVGDPQRVKRILCGTATDLGRERYFQGAGMVDVLRALQSV